MTTPTPETIRKLVKQIKEGDDIDWTETRVGAFFGMFALNAYRGKLDFAQKLHDALLPEAWACITKSAGGGKPSESGHCTVGIGDQEFEANFYCTPARAWLIAILKAYAWKLEMEAGE